MLDAMSVAGNSHGPKVRDGLAGEQIACIEGEW
jgi:hypothetical protein